MKLTTAIALILGLIMLLLVMVAAFVFLFQGRNTLEEQRDVAQAEATTLQSSLSLVQEDLAIIDATRSAAELALTAAISDNIRLEAESVTIQQEAAQQLAQLENSGAISESLNSPSVPEVVIVLPVEGETIPVGEVTTLGFVAMDRSGIATVNVLVNDEPLQELDGQDEAVFIGRVEWTPPEIGPYKIDVLAVNTNGAISEFATVSVNANRIQTSTSSSSLDSNADLRAQIETAVSDIRGLEPIEPVVTTLLTPEELRTRVETDLFEEYTEEDALNEIYVLASFDFLPVNFELRDFLLDLYAEQIAGFYDPETNEFVVISADDTLDVTEQVTHAHEFVHALQDQHYNLDLLDDEDLSADASMALRALAEGEATFVQTQYMLSGAVDVGDLLAASADLETPVLDSAPPIFSESLLFPYLTGNTFVSALHGEGGYDAIEYAWTNLPKSTEQILHPDRFIADDFPLEVTLPEFSLGSDWVLADEDVFGEAMLRFYLGQQLNEDQVETAATGWGGDRYAVYHNPETNQLIMVLRQVWDTEEDSIEFAALYPNYASRLLDAESIIQPDSGECWFGDDDVICLLQDGLETTIVRAPTVEIVDVIVAELQ